MTIKAQHPCRKQLINNGINDRASDCIISVVLKTYFARPYHTSQVYDPLPPQKDMSMCTKCVHTYWYTAVGIPI